ncbi:MAG: heavy-metal-associated domain-containing protein [Chitinophagia bacterium]
MKKFWIIIFVVCLSYSAKAQIMAAKLQASGLTCAMCSKAVFNALSAVPYVEKIQPDIQGSIYQISFKQNMPIDPDLLSRAVTDAGFSVAKLQLTGTFPETTIGKDSHVTLFNQVYHFVNVPSQVLKGTKTITLLDKSFVLPKEHKKFAQYTTMTCYSTGTRQSCCPQTGGSQSSRVYHVTL